MAALTDLPTVADFLDDATARLDRLTPRLALCRHEDVDTVAAVRELHRIAALLAAALWFEQIKDEREAGYASESLHETATDLVSDNPRLKGAFKGGG